MKNLSFLILVLSLTTLSCSKSANLKSGPAKIIAGSIISGTKVGPNESDTEWHITQFDPPHIQVHECKEATLQAVLTVQVEPEGDGTRLTHHTDYKIEEKLKRRTVAINNCGILFT